MQAVDARLARLADFLGIAWEPLALEKSEQPAKYLQSAVPNRDSCFVVNPGVMREWAGENFPAALISFLGHEFPHLLVHAPRANRFDSDFIATLSGGCLGSVQELGTATAPYEVAANSKDICGAFAGLAFGAANSANDHVFLDGPGEGPIRSLISIAGRPFMAAMKRDQTEIIFLGSADVADLDEEVGDAPVSHYFSRFLPYAMTLRHVFGEESWHPREHHASVIIDDPLLRRNYGFLNFESLLGLMKQYNFHTTVAFIPHNFRRNSPKITRMFKENRDHFGLCYHGNDHTGAELASTDTVRLNTMLQVADQRMDEHHKITGLDCDRVMVFPQGNFSVEAMTVLKSRSFDAAVNTVTHPRNKDVHLTLAELAQPAVLRYGGFPLFLRKDSEHTQGPDIAFNLFFGRPTLIVEHHQIFGNPKALAEAVDRINSAAPGIHWSNLSSAVKSSTLVRRGSDGAYHVRAYAGTVLISNDSEDVRHFSVNWDRPGAEPVVDRVLLDGKSFAGFEADDAGIRLVLDLPPRNSHTLSLMYRNRLATMDSLGFTWNVKAFVRRRLSEVRDNHLSKNPQALAAAQILRQRFLRGREAGDS
jgi:hypothetical protein